VRNVMLDPPTWVDLASGYSLLYLYSPEHKLLFVSYADSTEPGAHNYLRVIDFAGASASRVFEYPGPRTGHRSKPALVLSADGRQL
jgi:hypothetical protein